MSETLAPLLVKWLTHDFATPIATVMTASELLGDVADAEINDLVCGAARRLGGRLQLVRAALGPNNAPLGVAALGKLLAAGIADTPLTMAIPADTPPDTLPGVLIAGVAMLLADLRRGQPLVVAADRVDWASAAPMPDAVAAALAGGAATDSRAALAEMLVATAARAGLRLRVCETGIAWA